MVSAPENSFDGLGGAVGSFDGRANADFGFGRAGKRFHEVQEILAEQQPMIFTVTPMYYAAARSDIGNMRATPLSYYRVTWNAEELYFKK
jgi:hypothetical protein